MQMRRQLYAIPVHGPCQANPTAREQAAFNEYIMRTILEYWSKRNRSVNLVQEPITRHDGKKGRTELTIRSSLKGTEKP